MDWRNVRCWLVVAGIRIEAKEQDNFITGNVLADYDSCVDIAAEPGTFGAQEEETVGIGEATVGARKEQEVLNSHQFSKE